MNLTLIEPAMIRTAAFREKRIWRLQPLPLAVLAGLTPPDINIRVFDDRVEDIDHGTPSDLVGISVQTFTARRAYQIADEFRRRGVPVVLGGHHVTLMPAEAARHADAIVVGEAEGVWPDVLSDVRDGSLRSRYDSEAPLAQPAARADRTVLSGKNYLPIAMVETARGCPYGCSFCSVTTVYGGGFRRRSVADVVSEVAACAKRLVLIVDDNVVANAPEAKALFRALAPLGVRWIGQASLAMAHDRELMQLMRDSGCQGLLIGFESIAPDSLAQARKRWNLSGMSYEEAIHVIHDHGMSILGSFVIGMDGDSPQSLDATLEFAVRNRLFAAMFNLLTPYPGTELYSELASAGRLVRPHWWLDPAYRYGDVVFRPKQFEPRALAEKRLEMYRDFYRARSTALRVVDGLVNVKDPLRLLAYFAINLTAARDERARFGSPLGSDSAPQLSDQEAQSGTEAIGNNGS